MDTPDVSLIIPVYNSQEHLRECLASAVRQTLPSMEIIVVDDASTDDSRTIIEEFAGHYKNIVVLEHLKNKGQGAARNTGLKNARGLYVYFLDADDSIPPWSLESLHAIAREYDNDIVFGKTKSGVAQDGAYVLAEMRNVTLENYPALVYNHAVWNKLYRRDFLLKNDLLFVPPRCAEDVSFSIRTNLQAKSISITTRPTYNYRFGRQIRHTTKQKVTDAFRNVTDALRLVEQRGSPLLIHTMQCKTARNAYATMVRAEKALETDELLESLGRWQPVLAGMPEQVFDSIPAASGTFCRLVVAGRFDDALKFWKQNKKPALPEKTRPATASPQSGAAHNFLSRLIRRPLRRAYRKLYRPLIR